MRLRVVLLDFRAIRRRLRYRRFTGIPGQIRFKPNASNAKVRAVGNLRTLKPCWSSVRIQSDGLSQRQRLHAGRSVRCVHSLYRNCIRIQDQYSVLVFECTRSPGSPRRQTRDLSRSRSSRHVRSRRTRSTVPSMEHCPRRRCRRRHAAASIHASITSAELYVTTTIPGISSTDCRLQVSAK